MSSTDIKKSRISGAPVGRQLTQSEIDFMRQIESQNLERVKKLQKTRKGNLITAGILGGSVLGIYLYSMVAVKQEKFLDDFEEPKKINIETE